MPNYGSWTHEWDRLDELYKERGLPGLKDAGVDVIWGGTDCYFTEGCPDSESR